MWSENCQHGPDENEGIISAPSSASNPRGIVGCAMNFRPKVATAAHFRPPSISSGFVMIILRSRPSVAKRFQFLERFGGGRPAPLRNTGPAPRPKSRLCQTRPIAGCTEPRASGHPSLCLSVLGVLMGAHAFFASKTTAEVEEGGKGASASVNGPLLKHLPVVPLARAEIHSAQPESSPIIPIHSVPSLPARRT